VTVGHKANIMKLSDGLFLECARREARKFPEIELEELIVDNCCMQIVMRPSEFDVLLLPNLYGDIISDLCAGLVGGLGVTPGANIGTRMAIFEAVHGSAPDIAGQDKANPTALVLSAAMMLRHLGHDEEAFRIRRAVTAVISGGEVLTRDLGGTASTTEFTRALVAQVEAEGARASGVRTRKRAADGARRVPPRRPKGVARA
jgi:isocitrate dehydrogenase (NAD+)